MFERCELIYLWGGNRDDLDYFLYQRNGHQLFWALYKIFKEYVFEVEDFELVFPRAVELCNYLYVTKHPDLDAMEIIAVAEDWYHDVYEDETNRKRGYYYILMLITVWSIVSIKDYRTLVIAEFTKWLEGFIGHLLESNGRVLYRSLVLDDNEMDELKVIWNRVHELLDKKILENKYLPIICFENSPLSEFEEIDADNEDEDILINYINEDTFEDLDEEWFAHLIRCCSTTKGMLKLHDRINKGLKEVWDYAVKNKDQELQTQLRNFNPINWALNKKFVKKSFEYPALNSKWRRQIEEGTFGNYISLGALDKKYYDDILAEYSTNHIPNSNKVGRKARTLFMTENGDIDVERTKKMAKCFVNILKFHRISSKEIDSSKDNIVTKYFVEFYRWHELPVERPNASACFRFLKDDCNMEFSVDGKTYQTMLRNKIKSGEEDILIKAYVEEYLKDNLT